MKNLFKDFKFTPGFAVKCAAYLLLAVYAVFIIFGSLIFGPTSDFWRSLNLFGTAGEYNGLIRIISYVIFYFGASHLLRLVLKKVAILLKKGKAIVDLICSLIKYAAVIALVFSVLQTLGVDTTTILAGIGILGLVVGLGAQPLIADIIAGLFIVFEKVFDVGDIIVVDGFRGSVKEIGIRTTKIVDTGGNVKIINNADLKTVINMTDQLSLAVCDIGIEYGESLERVEAILKENLASIKEAIPDIKEGPFYKGVAELGDSAVIIRFAANCEEGARYQVERDMNRQFKLLFDKNNINIPFPQVVLNQPVSFEEATKFQQSQASTFVKEQKELSKGIAEGDLNNV
ncbi:MAG: mechanosensitive ion channel family protein [Clostridia bacterium]|nr:mechanosensitive ion channel family protein [Clostridia bacterium]